MGKLKTHKYHSDRLDFSYEISVDKEGYFTTMIPKDVVEKLESVGIHVSANRLRNKGYYAVSTLDGLIEAVKKDADKYSKEKIIDRTIVLLYKIDTLCSYWKTKAGDFVPNGYWDPKSDDKDKGYWEDGTEDRNSCNVGPSGFLIYVEPQIRIISEFPDGTKHNTYENLKEADYEEKSTLHWLESICAMAPDTSGGRDVKEIEYTEEVGLFFKNALMFIFQLDARFKKFINKECDLQKAIEVNGGRLMLPNMEKDK